MGVGMTVIILEETMIDLAHSKCMIIGNFFPLMLFDAELLLVILSVVWIIT